MLSLDKENPELSFHLPGMERREEKEKKTEKVFRLQAGIFQIPYRYKVLFISRNSVQAKIVVIFVLATKF